MTTEPVFTLDDDYASRVNRWFQAGPGSLVQTPDGRFWTVVYCNLDGYGVIAGDHPQYINKNGDDLVPPTHMLRDQYNRRRIGDEPEVEFLGEIVRIFRRVTDDGEVCDYTKIINGENATVVPEQSSDDPATEPKLDGIPLRLIWRSRAAAIRAIIRDNKQSDAPQTLTAAAAAYERCADELTEALGPARFVHVVLPDGQVGRAEGKAANNG